MSPLVVIPEINPDPTRRLGRHIQIDARSAMFAVEETKAVLVSKVWERSLPPLDQGDVGSCTGNAMAGILATEPIALDNVDEKLALEVYHIATELDGDPGVYPPTDTGSSVLAACKAARKLGLIKGYHWARTVSAVCHALQRGPLDFGVTWYQDMFTPDARGLVRVSGDVAGGHSFEVIGLDLEASEVIAVNSWGTSWGVNGRFRIGLNDVGRLLADQGEAALVIP